MIQDCVRAPREQVGLLAPTWPSSVLLSQAFLIRSFSFSIDGSADAIEEVSAVIQSTVGLGTHPSSQQLSVKVSMKVPNG